MDERYYQQLREIGLEHEVDDEGTLESNEARREAIRIARRIVLGPTLLAFTVLAGLVLPQFSVNLHVMFGLLICLGITSAFGVVLAATACGWLAHRICWGSSIPVRRMVIALALIYDLSLFGWFLVALLS